MRGFFEERGVMRQAIHADDFRLQAGLGAFLQLPLLEMDQEQRHR